jgi:small subunit ribosomal protein S2
MNTEKTLEQIADEYVKANVHYGHKPKEWNPKMAPYISHERSGYHIIDLVKTSRLLKLASNFLKEKAEKSSSFLFVGTSKVSSPLIASHAKEVNAYYINYRWLGGMLTNWPTIQKRISRLKELKYIDASKEKFSLSKKEYSAQKKELEKLEKLFAGIENMNKLPDVVIFTSQLKDYLAIEECIKLGIPCVSIVDTNCDPDLVPYPIPGNDDSSSSIDFILGHLVDSIKAGYNKAKI